MNNDEFEGYVTRQVGYSEADWRNIRESIANGAKFTYIHYSQLVEAGFTSAQALEIVKAHGCVPKYPWSSLQPPPDED